jgi:hypothetical protein
MMLKVYLFLLICLVYKGKPRGRIEFDLKNIATESPQRDTTLCPFA